MNHRKRKVSKSSYSNQKHKRIKTVRSNKSLTSAVTAKSDSTNLSENYSDVVIGDSNFLSFQEDHRKYVDLIYQVRCESKYLIKHITPIVLCCQYQNPIRCAYRLLHENLENVIFLMNYNFNKEETNTQLGIVAKNLTDNVITLIRILKTVKIIQEKLDKINAPLRKFELYVTHMRHILNYVVHVLLNTKVGNYKSNTCNFSPFSFRRLECRCCKRYVTFKGCRCTKWAYDTVPSQTIQDQLLSPVEDGPMSSNKSYINDWHDLKKCLHKIPSWKPNLKNKLRIKETTLNIDKKQSKETTRSHSLSKLESSKAVIDINSCLEIQKTLEENSANDQKTFDSECTDQVTELKLP